MPVILNFRMNINFNLLITTPAFCTCNHCCFVYNTTMQITYCCVGWKLFVYMELNPKFEYRNPKQIQMTKNRNTKLRWCSGGDSRFGHSDFEFLICFHRKVSCGEFRISCFGFGCSQRPRCDLSVLCGERCFFDYDVCLQMKVQKSPK